MKSFIAAVCVFMFLATSSAFADAETCGNTNQEGILKSTNPPLDSTPIFVDGKLNPAAITTK